MVNPSSPEFSPEPRPFLFFHLGSHSYGIPFSRVAEVRSLHDIILTLPGPDFECGTVVIHGRPIPVLDLRAVVAAPRHTLTEALLIVCWIDHLSQPDMPLGLIVDRLDRIDAVAPNTIRPVPDCGTKVDSRFIAGTLKTGRAIEVLFDVDHLLPTPAPLPYFLSTTAHHLPTGRSPLPRPDVHLSTTPSSSPIQNRSHPAC